MNEVLQIKRAEILRAYAHYSRNREDWEGARAISALVNVNCRDVWGDPVSLEVFAQRLNEKIQGCKESTEESKP